MILDHQLVEEALIIGKEMKRIFLLLGNLQ